MTINPSSAEINDFIDLHELDEHTILECIRNRFQRNIIHTYIGDVLIAVNPFKQLPIYGDEHHSKYKEVTGRKQNSPHVYWIAGNALRNLGKSGRAHCIIVGGISGAGKTESTKHIFEHILYQGGQHHSNLVDNLKEINPLLELFGNAVTRLNDNSSRFGKLITLKYDHRGNLNEANISCYMLERSRVTRQHDRERNFHIFYAFTDGISEQYLRAFDLSRRDLQGSRIISGHKTIDRDKAALAYAHRIMRTTGFTDQVYTVPTDKHDIQRADNDKQHIQRADNDKQDIQRADNDKQHIQRADNDKQDIQRADNDKQHIQRADNDKQHIQRADNDKQHIPRADNDKQHIQRADNDKQHIPRAENDKQDIQRADNDKQDIQRADYDKQDIQRADNDKQDIQRADNDKQDIQRGDYDKQDIQRGDNDKQDIQRGDNDKQDIQRADNDKQDIQRADNDKQDIQRADNDKQDIQRADNDKQDIQRADNDKQHIQRADYNKQDIQRADNDKQDIQRADNDKQHIQRADYDKQDIQRADSYKQDIQRADNDKQHIPRADNDHQDTQNSHNKYLLLVNRTFRTPIDQRYIHHLHT